MHLSKTPNLYLPGLKADGSPRTLVDIPGYWARTRSDQHRGGPGEAYLDELCRDLRDMTGAVTAVVMLDEIDTRTGAILGRLITHNVETDAAINAMLSLFGTGPATTTPAKYILLDTATAVAQMSGASINVGSGAQSTITVSGNTYTSGLVSGNAAASFVAAGSNNGSGQNVASPGANPDVTFGTGIAWSYGTANLEFVQGTAVAPGASTINIATYTVGGGKTHAAGDWVVAYPSCKDGPTAQPAGIIYPSAAATTTYTTGSGTTNRKVQLVYTYAAGTGNGAYTGLWIATFTSSGTYAASGLYSHISSSPQNLNGSTSVQATYTLSM